MKTLISSKIISFFCSLIFFLNTIPFFAQSGWYQISYPAGLSRNIYFRDSNNGIISGYKTSNGGQSWINTNGGYGYELSFPNTNTGYAIGIGYFSKTTNFGDNWISIPAPDTDAYYAVDFPTANFGYICGNNQKIFKTTNNGYNWINLIPYLNNDFIFEGISFNDTSLGFIIGSTFTYPVDTSIILKTTNSGNYWVISYTSNFNESLHSIFMINANTGFAGGRSLLKTTNSGLSWAYKYLPTSNSINSIFFPSANTGYGVCDYGDIIKTTDGGETWLKQSPVTGSNLNTVFFVNEYTGYACGSNGTVLKTTNGGGPPIGIRSISNEIPKSFSLSQNYPNPFNPTTKIDYALPNTAMVTIKVYDILGRLVKTLVNNEQKAAGYYSVVFDGTNFASGVYFYRIEAEKNIAVKKMVLLK